MSNHQHLTELIVALQNDVQSAIDYIDEWSSLEGSELGQSPVLMNVDNVRLRIPLEITIDHMEQEDTKKDSSQIKPGNISEAHEQLFSRRGLRIGDAQNVIGKGIYAKIGVKEPDIYKESKASGERMLTAGELEISFTPVTKKQPN